MLEIQDEFLDSQAQNLGQNPNQLHLMVHGIKVVSLNEDDSTLQPKQIKQSNTSRSRGLILKKEKSPHSQSKTNLRLTNEAGAGQNPKLQKELNKTLGNQVGSNSRSSKMQANKQQN